MRQIIIISAFFLALCGFSQVAPDKYFIGFTDKIGTPYNINQPLQFLTQRAVDRRIAQGIPVTEMDLPVNPSYIQQVKNIGVDILNPTKWMNGVTIHTTDPSKLTQIAALPFVLNIVKSEINPAPCLKPVDKFDLERSSFKPLGAIPYKMTGSVHSYNYGQSYNQIHMLNGDLLHDMGFHGEGKVIAIIDAGFLNANILPPFDSLYANGQILGTKDFVVLGNNVYNEYLHGMMVLSTMGGNVPGQLVGTAPKAKFWLLRSEDMNSENLIEEYNWVSAAEFADSVGADVINSSLGYTQFDDPTKNHTCADMNGHTTVCTRGANIAATRGIAVSNSAGNSGGSSWLCVSAPSDGDDVMAIGAVDAQGNYATFSSLGVDTNGRVKPNVASQGQGTVIATPDGSIGTGDGTSFSSPLIAGMLACLWQAKPGATNFELYEAMERSASQYNNPDPLKGYGIPDFQKALTILGIPTRNEIKPVIFPNPFTDNLTVRFSSRNNQLITMTIIDGVGGIVRKMASYCYTGENNVTFNNLSNLSQGIYFVKMTSDSFSEIQKIIKIN